VGVAHTDSDGIVRSLGALDQGDEGLKDQLLTQAELMGYQVGNQVKRNVDVGKAAQQIQSNMGVKPLASMFDLRGTKPARIKIAGKTLIHGSKDARQAIRSRKLVTAEDVAEAKRLSLKTHAEQVQKGVVSKAKQADENLVKAEDVAFERLFKQQYGMGIASARKLLNQGEARVAKALDKAGKVEPKIPDALRKELLDDANEYAIKAVNEDIADGSLQVISKPQVDLRGELLDEAAPLKVDDVKEVHQVAVKTLTNDYAKQIDAAKAIADPIERADTITKLEAGRNAEIKMLEEARDEAVKTQEVVARILDEQTVINMIEEASLTGGRNYVRVNFAGAKIMDAPVPKALTTATEKMSGLPILQATNKAWSEAFKPASRLEPELNLARMRAQHRTPDIIKHHVETIRDKFAKYAPADRKVAFQGIVKGAPVNPQLSDEMNAYFEELLPYVNGEVTIADDALKLDELNAKLPEDFKIAPPPTLSLRGLNFDTPQDLMAAMRNLKDNVDPMQVMWRLRIGTEQALAEKAMKHTITDTFGVKRVADGMTDEQMELVESLHKNHGWATHSQLGNNHYFSPEMVQEIDKLLTMMRPTKIHEITRLYDKVLRGWKSVVTVYNPGYYVRNGIGETMMGMMDNVGPKAYTKAAAVLRYSQPDEVKEALKTLEPWKRHATRQGLGKKVIYHHKTKAGGRQPVTAEDLWVLYHDAGLKTGFISTEFDHFFPTAGSLKASPVGQAATKINDKVRHRGEQYEDYFRMAHFISRLQRSKKTDLREAADDAAGYVRKYHYDYTDFTPFEKNVMLRIFPFYKWTRKSLPLMASMLFTRPGMVMLYPKGMQNLSYATGGTDPLTDDNGFLPNYEDVTPSWMQSMFAYPMGEDESGDMTYMNVATPQMDIYKMMQNPASATIGMLSPFPKVLTEQAMGHTMDPSFQIDFEKAPGSRADNIQRTTPIGSLLDAINEGRGPEDSAVSEPGGPLDERLTSFISGLGFYENNEKRQMGEQLRRNLEGAK
jgi:hypothetical protein